MAFYAMIGGRSIPHMEDFTLEEKIFRKLNLSVKKILFVPLAAHPDYEDAINKFKKLVPAQYKIDVLDEFENHSLILQKFETAEVIYFSGGCAEKLVELSKKYGIDSILKNSLRPNQLIMGISAGAILLSQYGMGDRYSYKDVNHIYNYQMVKGLGIVDVVICPHYDHDGLDCFNDEVKQYGYDGYAIEDDTAILITDEVSVFKQENQRSVYFFDSKEEYLMKPIYEKN